MTSLWVPGHPAPQGSKRHIGGGRMIESSKALKPWRSLVALRARAAGFNLAPGPVAVSTEFVLRRPASAPKTSHVHAIRRPDVDKLVRAILDALTGIAYVDDSQVTHLYAGKRLAVSGEPSGALITVRSLA
ncbi:RusA family crossover junction endodeoxyribonuclease [Nocardia terpenica]|uniref:RusA family crossover junction endodeoxyribonuclease n=1 Tax=Nocardia terpenica TaxID=455432 RepID=UPI001893DC6A|nr:RusA family crossover junction endodeoxyribonuclease [Nocardia terpenica]MBF6063033.1 RusA family crossover junction endodeoxyribonuclease [Nocardia terpenica]MBF6104832.1 RusA family crossover junction endodeoxyribonuclease [Nocardia terpenica]MBF6112732.1 RusA family crossover junction endodeoxyribonuclease [Nocardia terpenica]MBF6118560.1 RusA family crossover junction endodeoxyribonuclease [Nocardia terpenica]MBF6155039.1 RusA family crossover junction endodeoxyribonuclease [Nocardia te